MPFPSSLWRRKWQPTPVFLPGESQGQRNLVGCHLWGRTELDMTERLPFHFSLSCIGEGDGNPLQCSWLENPRDGGTWWAAIYGVAQGQTRLKRLAAAAACVPDLIIVKVKVSQSCLTLCDPMDYTVNGILQARMLEWVAFPSPRDLPNPGIEPRSPALQAVLYH